MPKEWFRMRLKKAYIYILSFFSLAFMFSACYYLSYQHALTNFNKRAIERGEEYALIEDNGAPTGAPLTSEENAVAVDNPPSTTILPTTRYVLETYNRNTNTTTKDVLNPPGYLVGLTKEEVEQYLIDYMKDLTLSEYNKGLKSFELISFSEEEIHLLKSYDEDIVPYRFYVAVKNGFVIVYNSDLKSVFEYTYIEAKYLSEEDRKALSMGIYVDNRDELYALLESFSS
ncbi:MAG TPA: hypothetical protein VJ888_02815 [Mobilitalea sp.]|nr:hypothetical protein [Mobilitalea sp.]